MANLWVSQNAAERFQERFCPGYSLVHAKAELITLTQQARKTNERSPRGQQIWRAGERGEVRLVVEPDRGRGLMPTVVTVLPAEVVDVEEDPWGGDAA